MAEYELLTNRWRRGGKVYRQGDVLELDEGVAHHYLSKSHGGQARIPSLKPVRSPSSQEGEDEGSSSSSSSDGDAAKSSNGGGSGGSRKVSSA